MGIDELLKAIYSKEDFKIDFTFSTIPPPSDSKEKSDMSEQVKEYKVLVNRKRIIYEQVWVEEIDACSEEHAVKEAMRAINDGEVDDWETYDEDIVDMEPQKPEITNEESPLKCDHCEQTVEDEAPSDPMRLCYVVSLDDYGDLCCPHHKGYEGHSTEMVLNVNQQGFSCVAYKKDKNNKPIARCQCYTTDGTANPVWYQCKERHEQEDPEVAAEAGTPAAKPAGAWWKSK